MRRRSPSKDGPRADYPLWVKLAPLGSLLLPLAAHGDASVPPRRDETTKPKKILVLPPLTVDGVGTASGSVNAPRKGGSTRPQPPPRDTQVHYGGVVAVPHLDDARKPAEPKKPCPKPAIELTPSTDTGKPAPPELTLLHPHAADEPCFAAGERLFKLRLG